VDKDTGYGAENKALIGVFVYWAILGEEVLDGGDAEGPQRSCWRFHIDRIAGALAQPTCSDCFSVAAKLITAGSLTFLNS